ncbi:HypA protein [Stachybotrys elegans]|uniref:HypA protein n=1 Tax=Stachybotrys elegans TaxID=80388 RepID=A0A8K0WQU0_9HYPO|nr:HypA protein [Stachybotrys elegans]
MATPFSIRVSPANTGLWAARQDEASSAKVSELLQKDLERHHCFFNLDGFHNHISHHLLSLYGTGSDPRALEQAYDANASYQNHVKEPRDKVVRELRQDWANASKYLSKGQYYSDFLRFFQLEIQDKGWQEVLAEYVFKGDASSHDMMARLYAGFLHPMIQLMYGVEWEQPAIVAEGLAQAAVHANKLGDLLAQTDAAAPATAAPSRSIFELYDVVRNNEKLARSARWEDPNRLYDGVMKRALEEAVAVASQVKVLPEELEERTVEMFHTAAWVAAAAALHPPYIPKFDFFLIHHLNAAPIFLSFNKQAWISQDMKIRLLEWKIRTDLLQYVARGCPPLQTERIRQYKPRDEKLVSRPEELLPRFHAIPDDGHTIKVVRALLIAQQLSLRYIGRPWVQITDDDMWLKIHYILLDSVEGYEDRWVRSAGFEEAWEGIPTAH